MSAKGIPKQNQRQGVLRANSKIKGTPAAPLAGRQGCGGEATPLPYQRVLGSVLGQVFAAPVLPFIREVKRFPDEPGARHLTCQLFAQAGNDKAPQGGAFRLWLGGTGPGPGNSYYRCLGQFISIYLSFGAVRGLSPVN